MWNDKNLIDILGKGGVVVMPTDTIYGIVGQALKPATVERIYALRQRNSDKPCIILIGEIGELEKFSIDLSEEQKVELEKCWPISAMADMGQQRALSVILDCPDDLPAQAGKFLYLHRDTETLAFRIPANEDLKKLLLQTGPLVAPSANLEALPPSKDINEAKKYFGNSIDLYIDGGEIKSKASKVIKLHKDGSISTIRD